MVSNHSMTFSAADNAEVADDMAYDDMADVNFDSNDYFPNDLPIRHPQRSYTVLSEADIRRRQEEDITRISSVLCISRAAAAILLFRYNWSVTNVHEEWFADEERVRKTLGLLQNPVVEFPDAKELTCGICFATFPKDDIDIYTAACGHPFCRSCWAGHISTAVNDGAVCLILRCPDSTCGAAVGQDMINVLATDDDRGKYARYFLRSYVGDDREVKWCPAAGCDYAVEFVIGSGCYDVTCRCSYSFCWKCTEEAHGPIDCGTLANWTSENTAVFKDVDWILADSKKCPKCKSPVKKNQGSMHITCCTPPCTFEFCWICLGPWTDHDACNSYKTAPQEGSYDESENPLAKFSLKRYAHYYERWAANESSRQKAMADLQQIQCEPKSPLMFMVEAWAQIVEYRRVLKWAYVYGYFLPEHGHTKRPLFEYLQGEAEANLEQLHLCVEKVHKDWTEKKKDHKELNVYLTAKKPATDLSQFRTEVNDLTRKTRIYFERLVDAMENGPLDVVSRRGAAHSWTAYSRAWGFGSSRNARIGTPDFSYVKFSEPRWEIDNFWPCDRCTYANPFSVSSCGMCVEPTEDD